MAKRNRKRQREADSRPAPSPPPSAPEIRAATGWEKFAPWLWGLGLMLAIFLAYLPVGKATVLWDDDQMLTANPAVIGPLGPGYLWTSHSADICPLTLTTFWAEHELWGMNLALYHWVNVLFHALGAVVLWRVLRALAVPGAWLGAALWGLYPVQVESVAWMTEMKNTESGLFYLLSLLFFLRWLKGRGRRGMEWNYAFSLLLAALALASKSSTVVLPLIMLACAWWVEGRWSWRNLLRAVPVFALSLAAGIVSIWTQKVVGADDPHWTLAGPQRLVVAGRAIWFYLDKLLWPHPLIIVYPRWRIDAGDPLEYLALLAAVGTTVALAVLAGRGIRAARIAFFAWSCFVLALLPVLNLANMTYTKESFVADHFQYLASMAPLAAAGAGLAWIGARLAGWNRWAGPALDAVVLAALGAMTWQRAVIFQNEHLLWTDTAAKNPDAWVAYVNLGAALDDEGKLAGAEADYLRCLALNPYCAEAYGNLGVVYGQSGRYAEAIAQFQKAIQLNPQYAAAYSNIGVTYFQEGRLDDAVAEYRKALELNPAQPESCNNLGVILERKGDAAGAIAMYRQALRIKPGFAQAHTNLANVYFDHGQNAEAAAEYQAALRLNPNLINALGNLGTVYLRLGQVDPAESQFRRVLAINPHSAAAHYQLGLICLRENRGDEAIAELAQAVQSDPRNADAHNMLGVALAQRNRLPEARAQFQQAVALNPALLPAKQNLARAQAMMKSPPK